jgi:hypothetical protein
VFKAAAEANVIEDEQIWHKMLDHVNFLGHTYETRLFEQAVVVIAASYLPALESICCWFRQRQAAE